MPTDPVQARAPQYKRHILSGCSSPHGHCTGGVGEGLEIDSAPLCGARRVPGNPRNKIFTNMLAGFALAQQRRKQDEELRQTMEQLSGGGSVWELGCVGVVSVVSFIKREFNGAGYCDEGEN